MKVGDLVRRWNAKKAIGIISEILSTNRVEVIWHSGCCFSPSQQTHNLEVINESR